MDSSLLLAKAHGEALRMISESSDIHFSGLQMASRCKSLSLSTRLRRQLYQLDVAYNWSRHITTTRVDTFVADLRRELCTPEAASGDKITAVQKPHVSTLGNDTLQASMLLVIQEEKMMELSSQISTLESKLSLATKLQDTVPKEQEPGPNAKFRPLPTLVAMRSGGNASYPGVASSSKTPNRGTGIHHDTTGDGGIYTAQEFGDSISYPCAASSSKYPDTLTEMRLDTAGDGGIYTEQEFRDYHQDNVSYMWNAAAPMPILKPCWFSKQAIGTDEYGLSAPGSTVMPVSVSHLRH